MIAAFIARLALRFALPKWLIELIATAVMLVALLLGFRWYQNHLIAKGVAQESARRDLIDKQRDEQAKAELAKLNAQVGEAKKLLAAARTKVQELTDEVEHEKTVSSDRQQRLAAGIERERVLIATIGTSTGAASGQTSTGTAGAVDSGSGEFTATLGRRPASDLEWERATRNEAILAVRACIVKFDALSEAIQKAQQ